LTDRQHAKLVSWELAQPRKKTERISYPLSDWLDAYIKRGKRDEATTKQLRHVRDNLLAFFESDRCITTIGKGDAEDFRIHLETKARKVAKGKPHAGLGKNTVRRRIGRSREFFNLAVRREIIGINPFADESVTVGNSPGRQFFVPADWIERCIKHAGCEDWRIMLAFARYAGMRSHETRMQRWSDIDIPNRKMIVRSTKTPPERVCPIFPELLPHLMRAKEMAPAGAELVVSRYGPKNNVGETMKKIIKRAGLEQWPKMFQNLRATRETELIAVYPIKDVASWLGNSAPIAMKHYAMTMQSSFERAVADGARGASSNPPHATASKGGHQHSSESDDLREAAENGVLIAGDSQCQPLSMPRAGLEPA
jgi:integrase